MNQHSLSWELQFDKRLDKATVEAELEKGEALLWGGSAFQVGHRVRTEDVCTAEDSYRVKLLVGVFSRRTMLFSSLKWNNFLFYFSLGT
jgi:hypothetical protein